MLLCCFKVLLSEIYSYGVTMSQEKIIDLLDKLVDKTDEKVSIGDVVAIFEERGFGPLILIPALIALLPTGGIPGVPSICGITLFLICIQISMNRTSPWIPKAIKNRSITHDKLAKATDKARPYLNKIESWFKPRYTYLAQSPAKNIIAFCSAVVALLMIPLEAVPFAVALPAFALCLTAIGITNRDGIIITISLILQSVTVYVSYKTIVMLQ